MGLGVSKIFRALIYKVHPAVIFVILQLSCFAKIAELVVCDIYRLSLEGKPWKEDDLPGVEHVPSGASSLLHVHL